MQNSIAAAYIIATWHFSETVFRANCISLFPTVSCLTSSSNGPGLQNGVILFDMRKISRIIHGPRNVLCIVTEDNDAQASMSDKTHSEKLLVRPRQRLKTCVYVTHIIGQQVKIRLS